MTGEATVVPSAAYCSDHNVIKDRLFTAQTLGSGSARVALQAPGVAILLHEWSV
jgi:hypothetical protein